MVVGPQAGSAGAIEFSTAEDRAMEVPEQWREYTCGDYFSEGWSNRGYFDALSQTLVVAPLAEAYENSEIEFFAVGRSGCDGIDFGYRKRHAGLWAFYPVGGEFMYMAATVADLIDGWCSNRLCV
jgi:hypothetical protein